MATRIDTKTLRAKAEHELAHGQIRNDLQGQARAVIELCDELDRIRDAADEMVEAIDVRGAYEGCSAHDMALTFQRITEGFEP